MKSPGIRCSQRQEDEYKKSGSADMALRRAEISIRIMNMKLREKKPGSKQTWKSEEELIKKLVLELFKKWKN